MSDMNAWNGGDPFTPGVVEDSIAESLRPGAPATSTAVLVRTLADAYALPPAADAVLARSRATLARRAEALGSGGLQMISSDTRPRQATSITEPPQPPRRRISHFATVLRTAAAVLVVALLSAAFFALLRGMQRQGMHPTPTPPPVSSTATPATATPTTITPQPPAPAGVYVTVPGTLLRLNPSTGAVQQRYPLTSSSQAYVGTPVVANGVVYVTYRSTASPSESDVIALSATSGAELWRTKTADLLTQLSLADGTLYGGTASTGTGGTGSDTFYALRASDGSVVWTFHTATLRAVPLVTGGVVYLADQPQNTSLQHIHALRASDGSQLWDTPLPQACGTALDEAVDQGMLFAACGVQPDTGQGDNAVYGLRASDGSMLWHSTTNGQPNLMAAGAGLVYLCVNGRSASGAIARGLYALDETSGAVRWQVANGGDGWPVFDGTTVYAGVASDSELTAPSSSNLAAFSASQGTLLWTYPEANQRSELYAPVIAGGVVYQILNEQVVAISVADGVELWRSPALVSQKVWAGGLYVVTGG